MGVSAQTSCARARPICTKFNPMLGFRGVRIAIRYPEIAEMQARAIFEGAVEAGAKTGQPIKAEIMIPLVMTKAELDVVKANHRRDGRGRRQGDRRRRALSRSAR